MVVITEGAGALLARIQNQQAAAAPLRMAVEAGDFVIGTTAPATDDEVLFHQGEPVLRLSAETAQALAGYTVGVEETNDGPELKLLAPAETPDP